MPAGTTAGEHHADRGKPGIDRPAERPRAAGEIAADRGADSRRNPRLSAARRKRRNRPSGGWWSTTASWCRGCATAPGSRPARSTRSAPISPSTRPLRPQRAGQPSPVAKPLNGAAAANAVAPPGFRFFDNRQKYLLFVSTCSEKTEVGNRISLELGNLQPAPPALRIFDAGVGDGTVLSRVMRAVHARFPAMPLYVVAQGDLLRRRPPDAGEDGGPPVRASRHRAGRDQSLLRRGAVADAALGRRRRKA